MTENLPAMINKVSFEDTEIEIIDHKGERWAIAKEVGLALGYADHRAFYKLLDRHPRDFEGKTAMITGVVNLTTEEIRIVSYHGIIRAMMLAKTEKAVRFRDWAETVLFEVMMTGRYDVANPLTELQIRQEISHKNIAVWTEWFLRDPEQLFWINDYLREEIEEFRALTGGPKIGTTRVTPDLFAEMWYDKKYSPDYIREAFPLDFRFLKEVEEYRKKLGFHPHKALDMDEREAQRVFRASYQLGIRDGFLLRAFPRYTWRAILRAARGIKQGIMRTYADHWVKDVERNKPSYQKYIASDVWKIHKKGALVYPDGPLDICWDCHRPISISTADLHHLTYQRLGFEKFEDVVPLCRECHIYRHPEKNGLPADIENPNQVVTIPNAKFTGYWNDKKRSFACEINGKRTWVAVNAIMPTSQVKAVGDEGVLVMLKSYADHIPAGFILQR